MRPISRGTFLRTVAASTAGAMAPAFAAELVLGKGTIADRFWVWAHDARAYQGRAYGLPGDSALTPVEGARMLGVHNIIFIRYQDNPSPPFEDYYELFKTMKRVNWSITGAGGITSEDERAAVLRLARSNPNITGVFMDDFFQGAPPPQWLAENNVGFPVSLTITLPERGHADAVRLVQSDWATGDYRSKAVAVDISPDGATWREVAAGLLAIDPGTEWTTTFPEQEIKGFRIRILSTYDTVNARSCGLQNVDLEYNGKRVPLAQATVAASSVYPGHDARNVITDDRGKAVAASLSVDQLLAIRRQLADVGGRRLDLAVTLYTHQLHPRLVPHLRCCDVISLWTWKSEGIDSLEANFERLKRLIPDKRIRLGCYMWDFDAGKPIPLDRMEHQCRLGLKWLKEGYIDGMIFLATNICDLGLESVQWTREWIAKNGHQLL
jgi:hypothetical protein